MRFMQWYKFYKQLVIKKWLVERVKLQTIFLNQFNNIVRMRWPNYRLSFALAFLLFGGVR